MATVLIPIPRRDFDPTEVAVSWSVLERLGHRVVFATPDGRPGACDELMISGRGLDPWSPLPVLGHLRLIGLALRADANGRDAYARMSQAPAFQAPLRWDEIDLATVDGLLLGGGHRARGMREFIESPRLQSVVVDAFAREMPVAAICHGVLLLARSRRADGRSVLHGRRTTSLTWKQERLASALAHVVRFWDRHYYRTYVEQPGEPAGFMSVEQEVTRALARPSDYVDVPPDSLHRLRQTGGLWRDTFDDERPAFVVQDGRYVSARWPGDAHTFARRFAALLPAA